MNASATQSANELPLEGKALLTGASGFIGGRLRDALLERGVDVLSVRRKGSPPSKRGRSVEAEYADVAGLTELMRKEKPDYVFHVAGATKGVTYSDFQQANVMPTRNLLTALREGHPEVKRFVHMSSLTSYGPSSRTRVHLETDERKPIEFYGDSKLEAELLVEAETSLPWTILRPGGVYGPGDVDYFNLFKEVASGRNVFFGNRERLMSAIYVDDMVSATLLAAAHPAAAQRGYFVCDDQPLSWGEFQAAIVKASGRRVMELNLPEMLVGVAAAGGELLTRFDKKPRLFNRQKAKMGAQDAWTCSSAAIRKELGWKSEFPVQRGVEAAWSWYQRERWL